MERKTAHPFFTFSFLKPSNKGFTLIELIVVISIITILISIGLTNYSESNKRARDARRRADLEQVRTALELYRSENGYYPDTGGGSWTDLSNLGGVLEPDYIADVPSDPLPTSHPNYKYYKYKATNPSGVSYYGYCLEANLEAFTPTSNSCTPEAGYNLGVRNP